jgi:hypothetical protein
MSKLKVTFDTVPVNALLDPAGGYSMRLTEQQIVEDETVYEEVIKEKTLPLSPELLQLAVHAVLQTMATKTSQDCRPRKIGGIIKCAAFPRGKLDSPYAPFDPVNCTAAVVFSTLKGMAKKVDMNRVQFVNTKTGERVTIDRIVYEGCVKSEEIATIMRGKGILVTGLNCQWIEGDTCTLVWKDAAGSEQTAQIVPTSSGVTDMRFAWPEALADVPTGSQVEFRFRTRGGNPDAQPQPNNKTVTLIEAELVPTITKVATPEKDGVQKGQGFQADGSNLGFNFATDHVSVKWMDTDGTPRQAAIVPSSATAEAIAFSSCELFDDLEAGTELTFEFELGGKVTSKNATLLAAE